MLSSVALIFVLTICVFLCVMVGAIFAIFSLHMFMLNEMKYEDPSYLKEMFKDVKGFHDR